MFGLALAVNKQKGVIFVMGNHLLQTAKKLKDIQIDKHTVLFIILLTRKIISIKKD